MQTIKTNRLGNLNAQGAGELPQNGAAGVSELLNRTENLIAEIQRV